MKIIIPLLLALLSIASTATAQKNIVEFYPHADSVSAHPPFMQELTVLCERRVEGRYVTFVGFKEDKRVLLAAVTLQPIKDFAKEISLSVEFAGAKPMMGLTSSWGYVFDRNSDGRIDYLALVGGAAPYKDDKFPEDYPMRGFALPMNHLEYFIARSRLIFNYFSDDNLDDTLDAVIHVDMDPDRDWVERQITARSTRFNGKFDEAWAFYNNDLDQQDTVAMTPTGVPFNPVGKERDELTFKMLAEKSGILRLLNKAVLGCGLKKENLSLGPKNQ